MYTHNEQYSPFQQCMIVFNTLLTSYLFASATAPKHVLLPLCNLCRRYYAVICSTTQTLKLVHYIHESSISQENSQLAKMSWGIASVKVLINFLPPSLCELHA